ncbi:MAG: hypothetical protein RSC76_05760 [Oscillospiraceae bacterium]
MKIEILYPELCNLFGDAANVRYLKTCLPEATFFDTHMNDSPKFLTEEMDLVYMGPMSERTQEKIITRLSPHKAVIQGKIENGSLFFFTGNALEILGNYIETDSGEKIEGLGIFDLWAKRNLLERHNSECEAEFLGKKIMGFKTQFTMCYPKTEENGLFTVLKGMGMNLQSKTEGIRVKNFFGTYLIGPLLILNPFFTKYLLSLMGAPEKPLPFEIEQMEAYRQRLADFERNVSKTPEKYKSM